jgi:hypothetical protein
MVDSGRGCPDRAPKSSVKLSTESVDNRGGKTGATGFSPRNPNRVHNLPKKEAFLQAAEMKGYSLEANLNQWNR